MTDYDRAIAAYRWRIRDAEAADQIAAIAAVLELVAVTFAPAERDATAVRRRWRTAGEGASRRRSATQTAARAVGRPTDQRVTVDEARRDLSGSPAATLDFDLKLHEIGRIVSVPRETGRDDAGAPTPPPPLTISVRGHANGYDRL